MTDPHDPIHATDLDIADARSAPARSGDALVVHGMLSMIAVDEPRRLEARIQRAIEAVHAESEASPVLARLGSESAGLGRAAQWRRRIALAGGGIGIAAVLGFAVLFAPSTSSLSGNEAYATLDSIRAAAGRAEGRTYRVRIERNPDYVPNPDQPRGPDHGRGNDQPRGPDQPRSADQPRGQDQGRGADQPRGFLRDAAREGELVLGPDRRYVLSWKVAGKGATVVCGFDGDSYWVILPDGSSRTADSPMALRMPPLFAATDPAQPGNEEDEPLTLDAILSRLELGYEVTFADGTGAATRPGSASPVLEVIATRRGPLARGDRGDRGDRPDRADRADRAERPDRSDRPDRGDRPNRGDRASRPNDKPDRGPDRSGEGALRGSERSQERFPRGSDRPMDRPGRGPDRPPQGPPPQTVRVVADASSFDVERLEATWNAGPVRSMTLDRIPSPDGASREASWFALPAQQALRAMSAPASIPAR